MVDNKRNQQNIEIVILKNNAFFPDSSLDDPGQITKENRPHDTITAVWDVLNNKLKTSDNSTVVYVSSIIVDVEVNVEVDDTKDNDFELNLFIRPQIPIVSI